MLSRCPVCGRYLGPNWWDKESRRCPSCASRVSDEKLSRYALKAVAISLCVFLPGWYIRAQDVTNPIEEWAIRAAGVLVGVGIFVIFAKYYHSPEQHRDLAEEFHD